MMTAIEQPKKIKKTFVKYEKRFDHDKMEHERSFNHHQVRLD
jgi:hypothetical protein